MPIAFQFINAIGPAEAEMLVTALRNLPPSAYKDDCERYDSLVALFSDIEEMTTEPLAYYSLVRTYAEHA